MGAAVAATAIWGLVKVAHHLPFSGHCSVSLGIVISMMDIDWKNEKYLKLSSLPSFNKDWEVLDLVSVSARKPALPELSATLILRLFAGTS